MYGEVVGQVTNNAGYFVGGITTTGSPLIISDESVKTDIQDLLEATSILSQLEPKTYSFVSPDNRGIPFDQGTRFGFIAQELQDVLPDLVDATTIPERIDSTGFVEGTSVDLLGIKYTELIPILVAGFKEQNIVIAEQAAGLNTQSELIAELQNMLSGQASQMENLQDQTQDLLESIQSMQQKTNNCCQDKDGVNDEGFVPSPQGTSSPVELGQNIPNPFEFSTRIDFQLPADAQVILEISDAQGKPIRKLIDGNMSAGAHSTIFDGSGLAKGVYYYTLYADGQLLTKRMMKL